MNSTKFDRVCSSLYLLHGKIASTRKFRDSRYVVEWFEAGQMEALHDPPLDLLAGRSGSFAGPTISLGD